MIIENYKAILDYEDFFVRINTTIGVVIINGFKLELNQLTDEAISVKGMIERIELEKNTDEED